MEDLSTIKKKQLVKHADYILEKRNEIKKIQEMDAIGKATTPKAEIAPSEQQQKKQTSSKPSTNKNDNTTFINNKKSVNKSTNSRNEYGGTSSQVLVSEETQESSATESSAVEFPQTEYQNHLFKIAEKFEKIDPDLSMFFMKRFYDEINSSANLDKHADKYNKCCLFCGHSFLNRNEGYHLMKQPSNKVVIRDVTKDDKLCSLNLKKFFGSKKERVKWSHMVHCLCTTKTASNNVLTYRCKNCHKYLIVPFDKDVALQVSKPENKQDVQAKQREQQKSHATSSEGVTSPQVNMTSSSNISTLPSSTTDKPSPTKPQKKQNQSQVSQSTIPNNSENSNEKKRKRDNVKSLSETSQTSKSKETITTPNNKEAKKKKKKNISSTTSASDFLKML